ncbi:MAG: 2-amino-4-hydroxy-6-hydroxymethyldihydropteridine diphosphokinase [Phycisphaerae bacterium]|nr:2-amino-4-hydroxy-6-hydroxymethyldihydropteridine diphosphokinase [Phycisphaerae bacterium]
MTHVAYVALGSNLDDRRGHLDGAVAALREHDAITVRRVSSWIETEPVGGPAGQGQFLNGAVELETTLSPHELLAVMQAIEERFGRVRTVPHGPRTLDLDLLLYDASVINEPDLTIPHPRLHERRFVLAPLAEIAPAAQHPILNATIAELLARLDAGA